MEKELSKFKEIKDFNKNLNALSQESGVYIFITNKNIPRLVGSSPILKIGETSFLKSRMKRYFNQSLEELSLLAKRKTAYRFRSYVDKHAANDVRLLFKPTAEKDLKEEEKRLLIMYFEEHFEVPPLNMSLK